MGKRRKKRSFVKKLELAERLRECLPKSEEWFWELWKREGMFHSEDKSNEIFCGFIPDIINHKYRYIIEVDGDIHLKRRQRHEDFLKDKVFGKKNYNVFRVEAFNYEHFGIVCDLVEKIRNPVILNKKPRVILRKKNENHYQEGV